MSNPKPLTDDEMNFDLFWEADNWECTHVDTDTLEESIGEGEAFEVVRVGVARQAKDIFAVPYTTETVGGTQFAYFEKEEDAVAFAKAKRAEWLADEATS